MNDLQFKIVLAAVNIRIQNGEAIDEILNSYPKLTEEEREKLIEEYSKIGA